MVFFLMNSLGFSVDKIISHVNIASFVFPISVLMHFISFSSLAALVRTSSTMLTRSGKNEYPYLVLNFVFFILFFHYKLVLAVGFSQTTVFVFYYYCN